MSRSKKIMLLVMTAIMVFTSGCGTSKTSVSQKKYDETIRIVYPISRAMGDKSIDTLENWFTTKYPGAKLEMVSANVTTISDTVKSELKNGDEIDIFVTTDYDSYLKEGLLADITDEAAVTKFRKSSTRDIERDGKIYALPIGGGTLVGLHYNKQLFEQYGLTPPSNTETFSELMNRINQKVADEDLDIHVLDASMLYAYQVADIYNSILSEDTQTSEYLKWIAAYSSGESSFKDETFQNYLTKINTSMEDDCEWFSSEDMVSSQSTAIEDFLKGNAFLYYGDVNRCYDTMKNSDEFGDVSVGVVGVPVGDEQIAYISFMDDLYLGVNSGYDEYSPQKQEMIDTILDYVVAGDSHTKNIFTFTGPYCSSYLEGEAVEMIDDPYFADINACLENNYIAQEASNTPYSYIFGRSLIAWRSGKLEDFMPTGDSDMERMTQILEQYRVDGTNVYEKSDEPIGKSPSYMEYQSNIVRSQETAIGNQVADMARDYMDADFALMNAGGIRASIPEGNVSQQTFNSVLPYSNYIVKIKVSGKTLKEALANAYNVGPLYKSGQFGEISGLTVSLKTNAQGYAQYEKAMEQWNQQHPKATTAEKNEANKKIVENICSIKEDALNLEVVSVKDASGKEIEDDKYYTVATVDYLLKDQDGYHMLGVLSDNPDADTSIVIYDRQGNEITGSLEEIEEKITKQCLTGAESFAQWVKEGNKLSSKVDKRLEISDFIYVD